jgi:hypothetical protein
VLHPKNAEIAEMFSESSAYCDSNIQKVVLGTEK